MFGRIFLALAFLGPVAGCDTAAPPSPPPVSALPGSRDASHLPVGGGQAALPEGSPVVHQLRSGMPIYPWRQLRSGKEGIAEVDCAIPVDGVPKDCRVSNIEGDAEFGLAALDYRSHTRYAPATHNGVPVEVRHKWTDTFKLDPPRPNASPLQLPNPPQVPDFSLDDSELPPFAIKEAYRQSPKAAGKSGAVRLDCLVSAGGDLEDCEIIRSTGDADLDAVALLAARRSWVGPELHQGIPVAARHAWSFDIP